MPGREKHPNTAPYTAADAGPLADVPAARPARWSETAFSGAVWDVSREAFSMGPGTGTDSGPEAEDPVLVREFIRHPGAVAVLALDAEDRIRMIRQYRHPVGHEMWEIPAGLLDVPGESLVDAAARELAEETDLLADSWTELVDFHTTPGSSSERITVFLARGLSEVPEVERHVRTGEEAGMPMAWVPVSEAIDAVLAGRVRNPSAVVGILALHARRTVPGGHRVSP